MPVFKTRSGSVNAGDWGYQLQQKHGLDAGDLARDKHDLIVMDFSADGTGAEKFSPTQIDHIQKGPGGRSVAVAYLSIGEASDFRDHWDADWTSNGRADGNLTGAAPDWLGPTNPDWPESRKVRYWEADWQDHIFNDAHDGWLDQIVGQGFDAAYLDIVDAYYYWAEEIPNAAREAGDPAKGDEADAAARMIDFVADLTAHARQTNPDFFSILQNGEFIIDALDGADPDREAALLNAIGGIAVEDTYFRGGKDGNNQFHPDHDKIKVLQHDFLMNGVPVFVTDYLSNPSKIAHFEQKAIGDGFIPYAAPDRDLDVMGPRLGGGKASNRNDYLTGNNHNNHISAKAGGDICEGFAGRDKINGGKGDDWLYGDAGNDRISGGKGRDVLTGGDGADRFSFGAHQNHDIILDFEDGTDLINLRAFHFHSKAAALGQFFEKGSGHNDVAGFAHKGTAITIKGVDLHEISGHDLLI